MAQLAPIPETSASADACPRCHKPLFDPNGLGWCKGCGYCRSVDESGKEAAPTAAEKPAPQNSLTATGAAIGQTPTWFWVTVAGIALIVGVTYALGRWLTLPPFERALLTTLQIVAGFTLMFVGQFLALLKIAPNETTLGFKDAVFPFHLYGLVFKRLPSTQVTIFLAAWGVALIVSASIFIGGLMHWFTYIPGNQKNQTQKTKSK